MLRKLKPSPAMAVAVCALFLALAGSAVAAGIVPLAKRALSADNAKLLQGKTAAQVAALAPKPTLTSVAGLASIKAAPFSLGAGGQGDFQATCDPGQKAVGGGYDNPVGTAFSVDTRPTPDGGSWKIYLIASSQEAASGTIYAVCLK
jgi:hypothetical protein